MLVNTQHSIIMQEIKSLNLNMIVVMIVTRTWVISIENVMLDMISETHIYGRNIGVLCARDGDPCVAHSSW